MERRNYGIEAVRRAFQVLRAFQQRQEILRLHEIARRTGLSAPTAFRMLQTLAEVGAVEREGRHGYRCAAILGGGARYRMAYASQGEDETFTQEWSLSIIQAAREENVDLKVYPVRASGEGLVESIGRIIADRVDLAIICQFNEQLAHVVSSRLHEAGIPFIAMGAAHAGAVYYGGNNYQAGSLAGHAISQWARAHWGGADELVVLNLHQAGPLLQSRMLGFETAVHKLLPGSCRTVRLEVPSSFGASLQAVRQHLRRTRGRRIVLGAPNDPCALGALRAFEEAGWEDECAVVGQGGSLEARQELRRSHSRLIGTVAYFADRYGPNIMRLAFDLLEKRPVPPAVFTRHRLLTPANVDQFYPNDILLGATTAAAT